MLLPLYVLVGAAAIPYASDPRSIIVVYSRGIYIINCPALTNVVVNNKEISWTRYVRSVVF